MTWVNLLTSVLLVTLASVQCLPLSGYGSSVDQSDSGFRSSQIILDSLPTSRTYGGNSQQQNQLIRPNFASRVVWDQSQSLPSNYDTSVGQQSLVKLSTMDQGSDKQQLISSFAKPRIMMDQSYDGSIREPQLIRTQSVDQGYGSMQRQQWPDVSMQPQSTQNSYSQVQQQPLIKKSFDFNSQYGNQVGDDQSVVQDQIQILPQSTQNSYSQVQQQPLIKQSFDLGSSSYNKQPLIQQSFDQKLGSSTGQRKVVVGGDIQQNDQRIIANSGYGQIDQQPKVIVQSMDQDYGSQQVLLKPQLDKTFSDFGQQQMQVFRDNKPKRKHKHHKQLFDWQMTSQDMVPQQTQQYGSNQVQQNDQSYGQQQDQVVVQQPIQSTVTYSQFQQPQSIDRSFDKRQPLAQFRPTSFDQGSQYGSQVQPSMDSFTQQFDNVQ
ncbi:unnamed protein product [Didymodactylos carnosus]|uniref:Uncharacterized protein n=1 Tax=Didymodactylos carnosus TaxID=1234261 RepID=A0A815DXP3_9BILA|nr:unnamed protein product [Didymodactylos carnosus]CAF1302573.1 unnamed protein product [Didymodactylos carnosus]CAF3737332.1 unnamed protein product [Didymodactylos carnosus]CAF4129492.1 unnamed protein product [Didymodactylos carnosus]